MSRRRRLLAGAGIGLMALIGWVLLSAWAAGHVRLTVGELAECRDPGSLTPANGGSAKKRDGTLGPGLPETLIALDARLDCTVGTRMINESALPVSLLEIRWPLLGPAAGAGLLAGSAPGESTWTSVSAAGDLDAAFAANGLAEVPAGAHVAQTIRVTGQPGCTSQRAVLHLDNGPVATIRVLGLRHMVAAHGAKIGFVGTVASSAIWAEVARGASTGAALRHRLDATGHGFVPPSDACHPPNASRSDSPRGLTCATGWRPTRKRQARSTR